MSSWRSRPRHPPPTTSRPTREPHPVGLARLWQTRPASVADPIVGSGSWRNLIRIAAVALALVLAASAAFAQEVPGPISGDLTGLDDAEVGNRLAFLEERLDAGQRNARIWQYGFLSLFAGGIVAGTAEAAATDDSDGRVAGIVGAAKGAIGVADLLLEPHPGRLGAAPIHATAGASRAEQLARAEAQLDAVARRADDRWDWTRHAGIIALNAAGGVIVGLVGDRTDAIIDSTVGFAVGQIMLWTMPQRSKEDLQDYQQRFGNGAESKVSWRLAPLVHGDAHGIAVHVRF